jgi:hypothetical protein
MKKVPDAWWGAYLANKRETKEATFEQRRTEASAA